MKRLSKNLAKGHPTTEVVLVKGRAAVKRRKVEICSSFLPLDKRHLLKKHLEGFVAVKPSTIPGAGSGVFAAQDLSKGFQLPYMGKIYKGEFDNIVRLIGDQDLLYIMHDDENSLVIDGHPRYNSVACSVAFRVNEPPKGTKASMDFVSAKGWAKEFSTISARTTRKVKSKS